MKASLLIGAAIAAIAVPFSPVAQAGTVTLTNDDTVTGTITSSDEQGVTVEHPDLGTLNIPSASVAGVEAEETDPIYVEPPVPDFFFGWDKTLTAGFTGTEGNTDSLNVYAAFDTGYENDETRWNINANVLYSTNEGVNTTNYYQASVTKDWLLPDEDYFFWTVARYENNRFTDWRERTSAYAGIGYEFIKKDNYNLFARLGAGAAYEAGIINETTAELLLGLEGEWDIDDRSSLVYSTYFYPSLDPAFSEFRNVSSLAYQIEVDSAKGLTLEMGAKNYYDSDVSPGFEKNDLVYYAALVLKF